MSNRDGQPVQVILDRRIPFVDAIFRIVEGQDTYGDAIALLEAAERRHGVSVVCQPDRTFGHGFGMPRREVRPSLVEMRLLLEDEAAFRLAYTRAPEAVENESKRAQLYPFVSELSFAVSGMDFTNDHCIFFSSGVVAWWSMRGWGSTLAAWANETGWMRGYLEEVGQPFWTSADFAFDLGRGIIKDYSSWAGAVLEVIRIKCARQGAPDSLVTCRLSSQTVDAAGERPLIYADFQNADPLGRLRLNTRGTVDDLNRLGVRLSEGQRIRVYDEEFQAAAMVHFSKMERMWVAELDRRSVTGRSDDED